MTTEAPEMITGPAQNRPASPDRGFGRHLRRLAGVSEPLLDWVPEERARFTRLGILIVNAGVLAALSLHVALSSVVNVAGIYLIPVVLLWGWLIVTFDGWLVATTHGVLGSKLVVYLPRLLISILLGIVIAEPLLLWVFKPTISTEIAKNRQMQLTDYESRLWLCNSATGGSEVMPGCEDYLINIQSTEPLKAQLQSLLAERDRQTSQLDKIYAKLKELEELARAEAAGTTGPGLTGRVGSGANARRLLAQVDQYRADSRIPERTAALNNLDQQIITLQDQLSGELSANAQSLRKSISDRVEERAAAFGTIGLLERVAALERLSQSSGFVFVAQWALRLLLIMVDSLPVLTVLMSRVTTYDLLVRRRLEMTWRLHERLTDVQERQVISESDVHLQRTELAWRSDIERIEEVDRAARARLEADLDEQIEELAARLRRDALRGKT